ncbi:HD domain-containing protein [Motilimonas cestriensis]|uniref:HD domain-containing protein n=2 Tax=Motilimonas cestriensis TaxID=2742685 RepID=A0ABS8WCR2_9GAMM|nr:HD domain-containing protein [Motilimonas cestriensis]
MYARNKVSKPIETTETLSVDFRQMLLAIENAGSFVGNGDINHCKRVAFIASQLAKQLNFSEEKIQFVYELGLIHDCGVSTEHMYANLVSQFDWDGAQQHCIVGYHLLKDLAPFSAFALPILYHHTHWQKLERLDISAEEARFANIIFLADRIDVLAMEHDEKHILVAKEQIFQTIAQYQGTFFDPLIVAAFRSIHKHEAFWISLSDRHIVRYTFKMGLLENNRTLNLHDIKHVSLILAYIVDQKSPYTAMHSIRVASLAKFLAATVGLSDEVCEKIEIAGLLHDLGKLRVPTSILEKKGALTDIERSIMRQHSYDTFEILGHVKGLDEIASWAAFHHEGLNGDGYPFHPPEEEISVEARIVAIADIFQALVQNRPYREGLSLAGVLARLNDDANNGKIDTHIVNLVLQHQQECYQIATGAFGDELSIFRLPEQLA